jgi:dihydrolipoamide dehydrogenase
VADAFVWHIPDDYIEPEEHIMVMGSLTESAELAIIGAGPGGYVAAIRAADLGKEVVVIEENEKLGGVCLRAGCIPSKALINAVDLIESSRMAKQMGLTFEEPKVDLDALRAWTNSVVDGLISGVAGLLKRRGVEVIKGTARFKDSHTLTIEGADVSEIEFKDCIIATGSDISELPSSDALPVWRSAEALRLPRIPETMVVVGGGYIGLEMGSVYAGLGTKITVVEFSPRLLMGADFDLVNVVTKHCEKKFEAIMYDSKVVGLDTTSSGFMVTVEHEGETKKIETAQVLTAVGRNPKTRELGLDKIGITPDKRGFIHVNPEMQTDVPHIYAIGDVVPGPMLAHKASREGKVAAEVIADHQSEFDNRAIPAVVFTDPELAWTGLTEREAEASNLKVTIGRFPLRALGRARTMGRTDGMVKIISEPDTGLVLGVGMVGPHVSELISEATLALEMGATLEDLMVTIHPHPTISEAIMEAAEVAAGEPIHISPPKKQ